MMRTLQLLLVTLALGCYVPFASAAEISVKISSPADGAKLSSKVETKVSYEVNTGAKGGHKHDIFILVDGEDAGELHESKGTHTLEPLEPGSHEICIRFVTPGHNPIGVQDCVNVSVE